MKNEIKAVVIGHAIGDALGVPVEFDSREELYNKPVADMRGYGAYPFPAGTWSDDTSMSIATMDSLANGKIDFFEIMVNFSKWLNDGEYTPTGECFDIGQTCLKSIAAFMKATHFADKGFILPSGFDIGTCGQTGEFSNGNGALMRIHPFALMTWYDKRYIVNFEKIIEKATALTHNHERAKLACRIYTIILHRILALRQKGAIILALNEAKNRYFKNPEYHHYARLFDKGFRNLRVDEIKSGGYVVDTLQAAVWCLLTTDNYSDCVLKAVNLGGDTDTVAAISGGLAGALYGYDAIPEKWKNTLIKREYIEAICDKAAKNWGSGSAKMHMSL